MIAIVLAESLKPLEGKTIAQIAIEQKKDPRDVVIDVVIEDRANTGCIISIMDEADVRVALAHPLVSFGTDAPAAAVDGIYAKEGGHPRVGAPQRGYSATTSARRKFCASRRRSAR
jgi:N-acyl-D-amino-acid deacylase